MVIAQLGNLHLRARRVLEGLYSGRHINRARGHSQEFSQHRPYNVGDDLKSLDWKIYGRSDRLVIKQYEQETNIAGTIVVDDSASMGFASGGRPSKLEYAKTMAAALAYLLIHQSDAVGLMSSRLSVPTSGNRAHLEQLLHHLESLEARGVWNIRTLVEQAHAPLKHRALVMVISDLLADAESVIESLRRLHAAKHDVIVFHLMDPAERDLDFSGPIVFEDMETGEDIRTEPDVIRARYQKIVRDRVSVFSGAFRGSGIDYQVITTDLPFDKGLGWFLSWRGAAV